MINVLQSEINLTEKNVDATFLIIIEVHRLIRNVLLLTQAQLDEYIRRLEEAETNIRIAEAKIADRDQRIIELERLLECMGRVRQFFSTK